MTQRVVITGLGTVNPIGSDVESFWNSLVQGRTSVGCIPDHWHRYTDLKSGIWAPLEFPDLSSYNINRFERMQQDPVSLLALVSAKQALDDSGLSYSLRDKRKNSFALDSYEPHREGVFIGTGVGGVSSLVSAEANHVFKPQKGVLSDMQEREAADRIRYYTRYPARFNPFIVSMIMPNASASNIGIKYGFQGRSSTNTTACASGTVAVGQGFHAVKSGEVDMALCGGSEYLKDDFGSIFRGFDTAKTLVSGYDDPDKANRPFDKGRTGFLFSEGGSACLILESLESAKGRGAGIIAEIKGYKESFDAHNIMMMDPETKNIRAMTESLIKEAGLAAQDIDYINTHGTGTQVNDEAEALMIRDLYDKGEGPLVNSTKSFTGHTIGAAGSIEALVTALSISRGKVHANRNLTDPIADLNFPYEVKGAEIRNAITHSFAFGGQNAALLLSRYE
ncbi:MAG: beta-ketoacyl-[acyl-carrier-protein] synthase family protein [Chitinivibrionales bacterium]